MASIDQLDPTGAVYARPLLQLATEQGQTEQVGQDLQQLADIIRDHPSFGLYLADPGVGRDERTATMDRIFKGHVSPLLSNFLGVLNRRGKLRYISTIASAYRVLMDQQLGNIDVDVTTALELSADELENVRAKVSSALGKNAKVKQLVDPSILGGLVVRVQDKIIDASVRYQLQAMKQQLLAAAPK